MQIDVNLSVNKNFIENKMDVNSSNVANGWVEIENAIKFPIQILKTTKDGQEKAFVKFPAKRNEDNTYSNVVFPFDSSVRTAIEDKVMDVFKKEITKGINLPEISDVSVTLLPHKEMNGKPVARAMASIKVCGIAVNGFTVKETKDNFFVQMPQYRDKEGLYHETFYGTNKSMQILISNTILEAYENLTKQMRNEMKVSEPEVEPKL